VVLDGLANPMVRPGAKVAPQKGEIKTAAAKAPQSQ
jgi:multidrug efflux system membrane fusion protein